jgi:hypothetical protein
MTSPPIIKFKHSSSIIGRRKKGEEKERKEEKEHGN